MLCACTCANAQDSLYFVSATTGAACQEVEYYNGYLFTGTGSTFRVYDVTQPIPYPVLFEYRYRSFLADFRIKDQYLYIAANNDGVSKWDISDPASPFEVARYEPTETGVAAHDLSFYGDTIFVAADKKVILLDDAPTSITKIGELNVTATGGFISGGEVKDSLYACTLGRNGNNDGVYIFNAKTLSQLSYFQQTYADPENVVFGSNNLLHIMGGTQGYTNPLDGDGMFYSLDITDPANPQMVFHDTIHGIPLAAVANILYGLNINDTIYVVTTAAPVPGWVYPQPAYGQIYVYDATNPADVHFITSLDAGLWSFDVSMNNNTAYIASEWYGIKTLDITDIMNEVDLGNTLTGGWAEDADKYGNNLVVANEGYGFKLFDITDPQNPVLSNVNYDPGFCYRSRFSHDGNFIYTAHSTYDGFRIYNTSDLTQVSSLPNLRCNGRMLVWNNYVVSDYEDLLLGKHFDLTDVSNPSSPVILQTLIISVNDMVVNDNGIVFVANNDSILVYDISAGSFVKKVSVPFQNSFQDATSICEINDTVYSFITWKGLVRYIYNETAGTLTENSTYTLPKGEPQRIAADDNVIYFAYAKFGIYAFSRNTMQQVAYYRTGLDLKGFTTQWGVTDLSCKDGYILLTEYFGQTTLLTMDTLFTLIHLQEMPGKTVSAFPNPFNDFTKIQFENNKGIACNLYVTDINGRIVRVIPEIRSNEIIIDRKNLQPGIYYYFVMNEKGVEGSGKIIVE